MQDAHKRAEMLLGADQWLGVHFALKCRAQYLVVGGRFRPLMLVRDYLDPRDQTDGLPRGDTLVTGDPCETARARRPWRERDGVFCGGFRAA